ncbi:MAG: Hpt domain-containing protein [Rickettsiales bacterium]
MTNDNIIIDLDFLNKVIGDDQEFAKELFEIFIDNCLYNISKLQKALNDNDKNSWYMASHAMKGSSASIGAFNFSKLCDLSQKISDQDNTEKFKTLENIKADFAKIQDFIKNIK